MLTISVDVFASTVLYVSRIFENTCPSGTVIHYGAMYLSISGAQPIGRTPDNPPLCKYPDNFAARRVIRSYFRLIQRHQLGLETFYLGLHKKLGYVIQWLSVDHQSPEAQSGVQNSERKFCFPSPWFQRF